MRQRIRWSRLDQKASEDAVLESLADSGWAIGGIVVGILPDDRKYDIRYRVRCDSSWATRDAEVDVSIGGVDVRIVLEREPATGRWTRDGVPAPQVTGCVDVDLRFSPVTNTLPIRRLALEVGREAKVRAAWLQFPEFVLEPLDQVYRHVAPGRYEYESAGGAFRADLEVNFDGLITRYGYYWIVVPQPVA